MQIKLLSLSALVLICCLLPLTTATSDETIYKWVDAKGQTHFSNLRPHPEVENFELAEINIPSTASSQQSLQDTLNRIQKLTDQLIVRREDLTRERLEARLLNLEKAYQQLLDEQVELGHSQLPSNDGYYVSYFHCFHSKRYEHSRKKHLFDHKPYRKRHTKAHRIQRIEHYKALQARDFQVQGKQKQRPEHRSLPASRSVQPNPRSARKIISADHRIRYKVPTHTGPHSSTVRR